MSQLLRPFPGGDDSSVKLLEKRIFAAGLGKAHYGGQKRRIQREEFQSLRGVAP